MELSDGEPRVRAGLYGNLGALLMGAAGRLEEALEFTEMSIEAGKETSIPDTSLTAGMHSSLILRTVLLSGVLPMSAASQHCHAPHSLHDHTCNDPQTATNEWRQLRSKLVGKLRHSLYTDAWLGHTASLLQPVMDWGS